MLQFTRDCDPSLKIFFSWMTRYKFSPTFLAPQFIQIIFLIAKAARQGGLKNKQINNLLTGVHVT